VADCQIFLQSAPYQACLTWQPDWGGALRRARQTTGLVILISATIASSPTFRTDFSQQALVASDLDSQVTEIIELLERSFSSLGQGS